MKEYYVYIMASCRNGTLYTGVTSNLIKRVWEHKSKIVKGFTSKYNVHQLVYYEIHHDIVEAIKREKNIQAWKKQWKLRLIEEKNPNWRDLYEEISGCSKFTNEVQHQIKLMLLWENKTINSSRWKRDVRYPSYLKKGNRSGKLRQLWIARHQQLLEK